MKLRTVPLIFLLFVQWLFPGSAAAARAEENLPALSLKEFLSIRYPLDLLLSPDGTKAVFTVTWTDFKKNQYEEHIFLAGSAGITRQITFGPGQDRTPRWSPDGRSLAFLSKRACEKEPDEIKFQIHILPLSNGEGRRLTDAPRGVLDFCWSPDGRSLIYLTEEPAPAAVEKAREISLDKYDDAIVHDGEKYRGEIWTISLDGEASRVFLGSCGMESLALSPDGGKAAFTTDLTGDRDDVRKRDVWVLDLKTGKAHQVTHRPGMEWNPRWSPDGKKIAFLAYFEAPVEYGRPDIFLVPSGGGEPVNITGRTDIEVEDFRWPAGEEKIYFRGLVGSSSHIYSISPDGNNLERLTSGEKVAGPFDASDAGPVLAYFQEDSAHGPDLFFKGPKDKDSQILSDLNPLLKNRRIAAQKSIRWKSRDGLEIEGVLTLPPGFQKGRPVPTLVYLHGGPYGVVQNTLRDRKFQVWANHGYAVLAPNFRGSAGYGHKFATANRRDLGGKDLEDILSGIDFLVGQGIADPDQLACTGGSYGGYLTNWLIARTRRFKAAVSKYGIFSFLTDVSCSSMPTFELDYFDKWYWEELPPYLERSPMKYVQDIRTPVLILHGEEDDNTFIANSIEMYTALKKLGRTVEFVRYPREGHGFEEPVHQADAIERSLAWVNRYISPVKEMPLRRVGEKIEQGSWRLTILSAKIVPDYSGIPAAGKFLEVHFIIEDLEELTPRWELRADKDISFGDFGGIFQSPAGIVLKSLGTTSLLRGKEFLVSVSEQDGENRALSLRVAFDIPPAMTRGILKVKNLPPVEIDLPALEKSK
ncbi:MAG: S9 family peptidase [bacterium]